MELGAWLHAELFGLVLTHDEHGGGTVRDLRGVAGGDLAVFFEGWLQLGEALCSRTLSDALVVLHHDLFAVKIDCDWHDFVLKSAFVAGDGGALLALCAEGIEVFAGDVVFVGNHVGADTLRREAGVGVTVLLVLAEREAHALDD